MVKQDIRSKFGLRVRELRMQKDLSQEDLGIKAKIHRTYIGSVERGEQNVSIINIEKIAKGLDVPIEYLFKKI